MDEESHEGSATRVTKFLTLKKDAEDIFNDKAGCGPKKLNRRNLKKGGDGWI